MTSISHSLITNDSRISQLVYVLLGSLILAAGSQICIPLPVPVTLQTSAVLLIGLMFTPRIAALAALLYLAEGFSGVPVFAQFSATPAILFGPSGGYLLAIVPAVYLASRLLHQQTNRLMILIATFAATGIIFISGVCQLSLFIGWQQAYILGVAPFIAIEIGKIFAFNLFAATIK